MVREKKNRYSGEDTASWTVKDTNGRPILFKAKEGKMREVSTNNFSEADGLARTHIRETGKFAQAVRL